VRVEREGDRDLVPGALKAEANTGPAGGLRCRPPQRPGAILLPRSEPGGGEEDVGPSDHDKRNLGNGTSGDHGPTHANGGPPGGEGWLRPVLENSSEVVKVLDPDGTLKYASPAFGRVFGYDPGEAVGTMNVLDHVHPDDLPRVLAETERATSAGGTVSSRVEYRFRHKDGSWRWVEAVGTYLPDDPSVRGVVVNARDITGRKEAEAALRRSEAEIFGILESITDGFFALDYELRFSYVNPQAALMLGRSREDLVGEKLNEDPTFYPQYRRAVAEGKTVEFEEYYPPLKRWYGVRAYPLRTGLSVYFQDVTERKEAERKIRLQAQMLGEVGEGVVAVDGDGRVAYWNRAAEDLYGWPAEEAMGRRLRDMVVPEGLRGRAQEIMAEVRAGKAWSGEFVVRRRDGTRLTVEATNTPVFGEEGGPPSVISVFRDVTQRKAAEQSLGESEERLRTLVERMPAVTYVQQATAPEAVTYVSPQMEDLLGYKPEECTSDPQHWVKVIHPEDRGRVLAEEKRSNETGEPFTMEYRQFAKDGRVVWVRDDATLVRDDERKPLYWLGVQTDVTESRLTEARLGEAEARYRALVERVPVAIYRQEIDHHGAVSYISPQIEAITGYAPGEYADPNLWVRTMHPDDRQRVLDEDERTDRTGEPFRVEFRKFTRDGRLVWLRDEAVLVRDEAGEPLYWQGVVQDITERKVLEGRLKHQALHDPLTGLPNRRLFVDRLGQALRRTRRRRGRKVAVLFTDLDGFKTVNDSLGHDVGDLLLVVVAERLKRCLRPEDTLARFGGDEFVVLLGDVEDPDEVVRVAERISEELRWPFVLEGRELYASASIGIALGQDGTESPEDLMRDADTAMYRAKAGGLDYSLFDPAMHERAVGRLELENDLRRATERGEFVVHYQPIVDMGTWGVWGVEALVRWEHPERGLVGPSEFVPVAEETGLIVPVGAWVLEEACRQTKAWQESHPGSAPLVVIVNLSARQLRHPGCVGSIEGALRKTGLWPGGLGLDVTESAFIDTLEGNAGALDRIKGLGVRVSIDDFGTGYSSLSYLKRLPADAIKIDKSFVAGLGERPDDTAIVRMTIDLAHTLGMEVIAEGVETEGQAELLRKMGCDMAQGFYFSRPLTPEDVPGFLEGRPS